MDRIFALTIHADYRCQHSGACCASDWDVPVELTVYRDVDEAMRSGRLVPPGTAADNEPPLIVEGLPDDMAAIAARTEEGRCVFFHGGSGLCVIHRDLGEPHLPSTCRYFPRVAVRDKRGTFISLTHYCPTAAGMLFRDDVTLQILESPPAFPPADYEGLVVDDDAWPPLLHPSMLMDLDAYSAWEHHMVARCAEPRQTPEGVVATLRRDARLLRAFTPGAGLLIDAVAALPATSLAAAAPATLADSLAIYLEVREAMPEELRQPHDWPDLEPAFARHVQPQWQAWSVPLNRYLAAKAFASWTAYQGRGVLSIVRGLEAALALVRVEAARQCHDNDRPLDRELLAEAIRTADFALNHLAVGDELAAGWSKVEDAEPVNIQNPAFTDQTSQLKLPGPMANGQGS